MSQPDEQVELSAALAVRLREAHRRVAQLSGDDDEKANATRRLLAISDAAKHDIARASRRLDALLAEWDHGPAGPSGSALPADQT